MMNLSVAFGDSSPEKGSREGTLSILPPIDRGGEVVPAELSSEVLSLRTEVRELRTLILSQNGLLEQLVQQQARIRVSRSQERALREAIRLRAGDLAASERLPARPISQAIRRTVREITGCRALGDVPAAKYDQILGAVQGWNMPGALRRIRKQLG